MKYLAIIMSILMTTLSACDSVLYGRNPDGTIAYPPYQAYPVYVPPPLFQTPNFVVPKFGNPIVTTNCYRTGSSVNCMSY